MKELEKIQSRKDDHIAHSLSKASQSVQSTWFECVNLVHQAYSDLDFNSIDTSTLFLNKTLQFPLFIGALTGGTKKGADINEVMARAAEKHGIGMMVGSQRIALEHPSVRSTFKIARDSAPSIPLISNIGMAQLIEIEDLSIINDIIQSIEADALAVHLNPLQEIIQPEGQPKFAGGLDRLTKLMEICQVPIIIKETGTGLSSETVRLFLSAGVTFFDVAGLGGTSFARIESLRSGDQGDSINGTIGSKFGNWGIPTAASIMECRAQLDQIRTKSCLFASGGIRDGLDMAKAIAIGANFCSIAQPFIEHYNQKPFFVDDFIVRCKRELATAMFLVGARTIEVLPHTPRVILPPLNYWIESRIR